LLINSRNESTYDEAFTLLNKAADKFVPDAEFHLAIMYEYGLGIPVNFDKAIEYYRRAGEKSHLDAIYHLALMYADGRGHPQDFRKASSLLERAAADNHAPSTYFMGVFKFHGYGCMPNYDLALQWFERAAAIGDFRIQEAAENATQELSQLLDLAKKHNDNIIEKYQILSERNDD
jgi:TPR repeat protein